MDCKELQLICFDLSCLICIILVYSALQLGGVNVLSRLLIADGLTLKPFLGNVLKVMPLKLSMLTRYHPWCWKIT